MGGSEASVDGMGKREFRVRRGLGLSPWLGMLFTAANAGAQTSPQIPIPYPEWSASDGLGRVLPTAAETGPPRPGKYVGLFYYLWHGAGKSTT